MLANLDRFDNAIAGFDGAIALRPDNAEAYNNRGIVLQDLKRLDDALANFDKAIAVMSVQEPLYRLLQQMSPDIEIVSHNEVPAGFDYHCPLMSLPLALGTTLQNIPS